LSPTDLRLNQPPWRSLPAAGFLSERAAAITLPFVILTNRLLINYIAEPAFDQELCISFAHVIDKPGSARRPNLDLVSSDATMVLLPILYLFPVHCCLRFRGSFDMRLISLVWLQNNTLSALCLDISCQKFGLSCHCLEDRRIK